MKTDSEYVTIARKDDLLPGECKVVQIKNRTLALANVSGAYYATDNACLHLQGPLGDGVLAGEMIVCPWHGWQFNVKTGESALNQNVKIQTFEIQVCGEDVQVKI